MSSARHWVSGVVSAVVASGLVLVTSPSHGAPDETATPDSIELQARTNLLVNDKGFNLPPGSSFNSISPSINDDGDVAFGVQLVHDVATGTDRPGVWLGRSGEGKVAYEGRTTDRINPDVSINNAGSVAFTLAPNDGIDNNAWVYDPTSDSAEMRTSLPVTPTGHSTPTITSDGTVVTRAGLGSGDGWLATSATNEGSLYASDHSVSGDPYYYVYSPTSNDAGQIAGKLGTDPDDYGPVEIRRFDAPDTSERLLANVYEDSASPYASFDNSVSMNNEGTVALIAKRTDGTKVLLRTDGTTTTEVVVAGADQPIHSFESFAPDINDNDQIVFRATDAEGQAIYVAAADGTLTRVIARGDEVDTDNGPGQVAQHNADNVFGGAPKINASGDVVFTAALTPVDDNQVEWGTGVFVAYAGNDGGSPQLEVGPDALSLEPGLWKDATETMTISNPGSADLVWKASSSDDWLAVEPNNGTVEPGESVDVAVTADRGAQPAGSYSGSVTVTSGNLDPAVAEVTMKVGRADVPIDIGGAAYTDKQKVRWLADRQLGKGNYGLVGSTKVQRTKKKIAGTKSDKLFRSRRVGNLTYRMRDLPAGTYRLTLGFVEYTNVKRGQRLFNVDVDGVRKLRKYDVRRHAKRLEADLKTITVRHEHSGDLVVKLRGVRAKPILSALRLTEK